MVLQPKPEDYPRIRKALKLYKVTSVITGVMLLLLCGVMIMRYVFKVELFLFTPTAIAEFLPTIPDGQEEEFARPGFDLFKAFLVAHGWFYVLYLVSNFLLWSPMRWKFSRFLLLALGGVIPLLSFFLEVRVAREVTSYLDAHESGPGRVIPASTSDSAVTAATDSKGQK